MSVRIKRAYALPEPEDGVRVLVDRYWPRGVQRDTAELEDWLKDVAPSPKLIAWFGHRAERWEEFKQRYREELDARKDSDDLCRLRDWKQRGRLTLVYGARDQEHNNALALAEYLG